MSKYCEPSLFNQYVECSLCGIDLTAIYGLKNHPKRPRVFWTIYLQNNPQCPRIFTQAPFVTSVPTEGALQSVISLVLISI